MRGLYNIIHTNGHEHMSVEACSEERDEHRATSPKESTHCIDRARTRTAHFPERPRPQGVPEHVLADLVDASHPVQSCVDERPSRRKHCVASQQAPWPIKSRHPFSNMAHLRLVSANQHSDTHAHPDLSTRAHRAQAESLRAARGLGSPRCPISLSTTRMRADTR